MTGATLCSGIMAPEVAMPDIDWRWCAEIEPFPCSVIKERRPDIPNLGDITAADFCERAAALGHLDVLVAGTPCQAFSVAGSRQSLADERGNLTLRLVEIVHAINPGMLLWENVPGVLSTKDNAFGCFLAGLIGASEAVVPARKWSRAGVVSGPLGTAAWRILDAQYFGLAQRRQRVFLVFCFGDRHNPAEILFEFEGVRRDFAPSRETRENVAPTISARTKGGGGLGTDFDLGRIANYDLYPSLTASGRGVERVGDSRGQDPVVVVTSMLPIGLDEEQNATVDFFGTLKARTEGGGFEGAVFVPGADSDNLVPVIK